MRFSENMSLLFKWNCETFPVYFIVLKSLPLGSYHLPAQVQPPHLPQTTMNWFPPLQKRVAVNFNNQYRTYPVTEREKNRSPDIRFTAEMRSIRRDSWQRNGDKQRRDNVKLRRIKFRLTSLAPLPDAATPTTFSTIGWGFFWEAGVSCGSEELKILCRTKGDVLIRAYFKNLL